MSNAGGAGSQTQVRVRGAEANHILVLIDGARANDPATGDEIEANFKVAAASVEKRSAARNYGLQKALAAETGGKHYELHQMAGIVTDVPALKITETSERRFALWNTWVVLILAIILMLGEWLTRKLMNLR